MDWIIYMGTSMKPAFRGGDVIYYEPYGRHRIRPGDVVVFPSPRDDRLVVHRVDSVAPKGIQTRGDRGGEVDPWILCVSSLLGRAVIVRRGRKRRKVVGGLRGRLYARAIQGMGALSLGMTLMLRPLYGLLLRIGIARLLLHRIFKTRIISYEGAGGREMRLLMGPYVIGRLPPQSSQWKIKPPFRLIIDAARLREQVLAASDVDPHG